MTQAFLALDYVVGAGDQAYARQAVQNVLTAIAEARVRGIPVIYSKIGFLPGYPDVSNRNAVFKMFADKGMFAGPGSRLVDDIKPAGNEPVIDKKRFSAFAGSGLSTILRSLDTTTIVMAGLSTSGVVLSTALELLDADSEVTILSDACADPKQQVHDTILGEILSPRTPVMTVAEWIAGDSRHKGDER